MVRLKNAALIALLSTLLVQLVGCAGVATPATQEIPDWVRVVVPERDGRLFFVGGVAFAATSERGVEAAMADARSQIHLQATHDFTEVFNRGIRESGVETSAMERLDLKNSITGSYGSRMTEIARQDSVFFKPCGGDVPSEQTGDGTPVCQIFVLMSVGRDEWDGGLGNLLVAERARRREEGEENLARFAEWISRQVLGEQPVEEREHTR